MSNLERVLSLLAVLAIVALCVNPTVSWGPADGATSEGAEGQPHGDPFAPQEWAGPLDRPRGSAPLWLYGATGLMAGVAIWLAWSLLRRPAGGAAADAGARGERPGSRPGRRGAGAVTQAAQAVSDPAPPEGASR